MVDSVLPTQGAQVQSVVRELRSRMPHGEANKKPKHTDKESWDSPDGPVVKNPPANAGNVGSIPDLGRFHMPNDHNN